MFTEENKGRVTKVGVAEKHQGDSKEEENKTKFGFEGLDDLNSSKGFSGFSRSSGFGGFGGFDGFGGFSKGLEDSNNSSNSTPEGSLPPAWESVIIRNEFSPGNNSTFHRLQSSHKLDPKEIRRHLHKASFRLKEAGFDDFEIIFLDRRKEFDWSNGSQPSPIKYSMLSTEVDEPYKSYNGLIDSSESSSSSSSEDKYSGNNNINQLVSNPGDYVLLQEDSQEDSQGELPEESQELQEESQN